MTTDTPANRLVAFLRRYPGRVALLSGALTTFAFAPFSLYPLAVLGPAILFLLLPQQAGFRLGYLFGLGLLGSGVSWLYVSIAQFGNLGVVAPVMITLLFITFIALLYGLAGWLCQRLGRAEMRLNLLFIYPAVWGLVEWLRDWFLTGFPWLSLGYSQIDGPLAGYAPLLGVYGVSWLVALSAGMLLLLLIGSRHERGLALAGLVLIWALGGLLDNLRWTTPKGEPIRVALVQGNIPQKIKWEPDQLLPTLKLFSGLTEQHLDADLVIWPETAVPSLYSMVKEGFIDPLQSMLAKGETELVFGVVVADKERDGYFNAMLSVGTRQDSYFKRHLVPFTEYLPLKWLFDPVVQFFTIPMSNFSAGTAERPLLKVGPHLAGLSICYEDAFGREMIEALPMAEFLINASNDAWFGDSLAPHQHLEIARMRARESGRYLLRSTNTGISAIISPEGGLVAVSPLFARHVLRGEIRSRQGMTFYSVVGNHAIVLVLIIMLAVGRLLRTGREPES